MEKLDQFHIFQAPNWQGHVGCQLPTEEYTIMGRVKEGLANSVALVNGKHPIIITTHSPTVPLPNVTKQGLRNNDNNVNHMCHVSISLSA